MKLGRSSQCFSAGKELWIDSVEERCHCSVTRRTHSSQASLYVPLAASIPPAEHSNGRQVDLGRN